MRSIAETRTCRLELHCLSRQHRASVVSVVGTTRLRTAELLLEYTLDVRHSEGVADVTHVLEKVICLEIVVARLDVLAVRGDM